MRQRVPFALSAASLWLVAWMAVTPVVGVASPPLSDPSAAPQGADMEAIPLDCNPEDLPHPQSEQCRVRRHLEGRRLFEEETFGGNGRTCVTCHSRETGTISPQDVQARLADPEHEVRDGVRVEGPDPE